MSPALPPSGDAACSQHHGVLIKSWVLVVLGFVPDIVHSRVFQGINAEASDFLVI